MKLDEQVKRFYDLESFGINEREGVHDRFVKGISRKEGRYEIGLKGKYAKSSQQLWA